MCFEYYDDIKSDDEYIIKIRDLCSQQSLFSLEELSVLTFLFESLSGKPPTILAVRFRADHCKELDILDVLERQHQFLKRTEDRQFYTLSPYALPLAEAARAIRVLDIMAKIYQNLKELYRDHLNNPIEVAILIDGIDEYDIDKEEDEDELLEALYYLSEVNGVWSGKSNNFPYAEGSTMCIAESVLRNDFMGDIIMKYFDTRYANPNSASIHNSSMSLDKAQTKLTGANNADPDIQPVQPQIFGKLKWIQLYWRILLKRRNIGLTIVGICVIILFILQSCI